MRDLTTDELREACEAAGLMPQPLTKPEMWGCCVTAGGCSVFAYQNDPMLPAYVASLLVTKVRERELNFVRAMIESCWQDGGDTCDMAGDERHVVYATDAQRIRAALAVLREVAP